MSSLTSDGAGRRSDWHRWERSRGLPASADGINFAERFADDFALLRSTGISHVHLTLDWSRIEPFPGRLDHEAIETTHMRLMAAKEAGLAIWAILLDGPLPGWFSEDTDGFRTGSSPPIHWGRHVDRMAEMFDQYVAAWTPIADPIGWTLRSHYFDAAPPGRRSVEDTRLALEGGLEATMDAHRLLASGPNPVVGSFGLPTLHRHEGAGIDHLHRWEQIFRHSWMRAIAEGVLEWPWKAPVERPDFSGAFDALEIGIRSPFGINPSGMLTPWPPDVRRDASGFSPDATGLVELLDRTHAALPNHDLIVGSMGLHDDDDRWRSELFQGWLAGLLEARNSGAPIRGVFLDPVVDGYSGLAGDFVECGVFDSDREPKPSFGWIEAQRN